MQASLRLRSTGALAALPLLVLLVLAGTGFLGWTAAGLAGVAVLGGSTLLSGWWVRDLGRIAAALRRMAGDGEVRLPPALSSAGALARQAEQAARAAEARTAALEEVLRIEQGIVQRLPDPLIVLGPDRLVQRANAAAHAVFGGETGAVLRHPGLRAAIDRALAEGRDQAADIRLPVPIGRDIHASVIPLPGSGRRIVAVLSDRSRERAIERMRADFVANASHELRTPLASLIGFIETLRGPAADDQAAQTRFLAIMAEQADRMNRLIDDLLSLSRIELTEHQPPSGLVDLAGLARRMADAFTPQLQARRVALSLELAPDLPVVTGDGDQLEQVLQNLLENALKYGREGGTIRLAVQIAGGVTVTVADDGQGIARVHIPRLTERFYRADTHRSRAVGGTGLGLAIVKHIVNRHRGRLVIESTEGVGTTVTVWLPAPAPPVGTGATG